MDPRLQTFTAFYCTEYCRQLKHNGKYCNIILKYYNLIGPLSCMRSIFDRNFVMRRIPLQLQVPVPCNGVKFGEQAAPW